MDFQLSEEQQLIRNLARRIAMERVAPRAAEIDAKEEYPEDIFAVYRDAGLLGLTIPEAYGGSEAPASWRWPSPSRRWRSTAARPGSCCC